MLVIGRYRDDVKMREWRDRQLKETKELIVSHMHHAIHRNDESRERDGGVRDGGEREEGKKEGRKRDRK